MKSYARGLTALLFASSLIAAQNARPTLEVQTATGQTTFRIGERIPLRLSFFNPDGKPYLVKSEPSGFRNRWSPEIFAVHPTRGWSDPIGDYLAQATESMSLQSPSSFPPPSKALQVLLDLNEWVRFDEPGDYSVTITSRRVAAGLAGPNALVESSIALHIVPASPEWQNAKLQWIRSNMDPYKSPWRQAQAELLYLATPAAVDEMVSRLRDELGPGNSIGQCAVCLGIIGLSDTMRKIAVASMTRRIEEPDFQVTPKFFKTMSYLHGGKESNCGRDLRPLCSYDTLLWLKIYSALPTKDAATHTDTLKTLNDVGTYIRDPRVKERLKSLPKVSWSDSAP